MECESYSQVVKESKNVITECFKKFKISETFVAFNGGKDCTVLMDLIFDILNNNHIESNAELKETLRFVYIKSENSFPELDNFIHDIENMYNIKLSIIGGDIKSVLTKILHDDPNIKACLMGTRRSDPFSENLSYFQMTDNDWPQIMRVNPILNWSYSDIWDYLLNKQVPYCCLYDQGYTSLGNRLNTIPNPSLKVSSNGVVIYKPAYMLKDGSLERSGRLKKLAT